MPRLIPEVRIVEVGPRDGLQSIKNAIPTETKIELIHRLRKAGLRAIELTSVVSPHRIPQLADCQQVLADPTIKLLLANEQEDLRLPVLVPNTKGLEIALSHDVKEVAVFVSATEGFSKANINSTVQQGIEKARTVAQKAIEAGIAVRGYVSCIFVDPYDGPTKPSSVLHCVKELIDMGCYEVSLGDTTGAGTPAKVTSLVRFLERNGIPLDQLAGHFHDTYGQGAVNVLQAYLCGIRVFDSSVGGLGGCPFAPGAKGNVSTEDLVFMFHNAGINTGVDLAKLAESGRWITERLKQPGSRSSQCVRELRPREKKSRLSSFRPVVYVKESWNRVKYSDSLHIYQTGTDLNVVLNRPNSGNALTKSMISGLIGCFRNHSSNPLISRIILTGNGRYFCTGLDARNKNGTNSERKPRFDDLMQLFEMIDQSPKTVIACLNGHARGAGAALAFVCDQRVMVKTATVDLSETRRRPFPVFVSRYGGLEWKHTLGSDAISSSRPITGTELKTLGLVAEIAEGQKDLRMKLETHLNCRGTITKNGCLANKEIDSDQSERYKLARM
ncbi:3-hydroxymethyl-3-methylglutaryl-coenzyme A lyase [Talaromyces proteolyticus]|uniref:hydroxymethylglutaryl-CoA lyase n=1 Tax=Talaromyces proteolyticus TaxID=1131652 RepID=A0AAD4PU23_9EURO|nr:3-hydroxymethyl-3-methylglutaryl-coenzyme A lyase [Talaromyces proteolyticus]KAH8688819.1 3-hydroxymethyl-3-methylglutaryl-coenzyme A lyase [Talaromyces proteolyticus]